jgi:hypothetical protein
MTRELQKKACRALWNLAANDANHVEKTCASTLWSIAYSSRLTLLLHLCDSSDISPSTPATSSVSHPIYMDEPETPENAAAISPAASARTSWCRPRDSCGSDSCRPATCSSGAESSTAGCAASASASAASVSATATASATAYDSEVALPNTRRELIFHSIRLLDTIAG